MGVYSNYFKHINFAKLNDDIFVYHTLKRTLDSRLKLVINLYIC